MPIARNCTAVLSDDIGRLNPVVEWQRHVETRDRIWRVQRKTGAGSIFGKRPTRKGVNLISVAADPKIQTQKKTPEGVFFFGFGGPG